MTDFEFVRAFEACELSNESFHHRDHIRLAWIYLQRYGVADATIRIAACIRRFAAHHGKSDKYHETVTVAWMHVLEHASKSAGVAASFDEIAATHPYLLDKNYLGDYYSEEVLASQTARETFVQPDRKPLFDLARG